MFWSFLDSKTKIQSLGKPTAGWPAVGISGLVKYGEQSIFSKLLQSFGKRYVVRKKCLGDIFKPLKMFGGIFIPRLKMSKKRHFYSDCRSTAGRCSQRLDFGFEAEKWAKCMVFCFDIKNKAFLRDSSDRIFDILFIFWEKSFLNFRQKSGHRPAVDRRSTGSMKNCRPAVDRRTGKKWCFFKLFKIFFL